MKKFKKFLMIILVLAILVPCGFAITACSFCATPYVISIEKTDTQGLVDIYTITYSDGTEDTFEVTNGKDGEDGKASILDIYNKYVTEYGEISYADFLKQYLSVSSNTNSVVINECLQSCLKLYTEFTVTETVNYYYTQDKVAIYTGSAIVYRIDSDYSYIITNYHVVYQEDVNKDNGGHIARKITGYLYGSESYPAETEYTENGYIVYDYGSYGIPLEYMGGSITHDIAILRVPTNTLKRVNSNVQPVTLAHDYYVGETAIAIGNPEDEGISVTEGIVSVDNEYINLAIDSTTRSYRSLRIDTALYSGNSGGGLFNYNGDLIGITNAGDSTDQNVNYAIPIQIVKGIADNIIYYYNDNDSTTNNAYKIKLGFTVQSENSKYVYDEASGYGNIVEDIVVSEVSTNSIASKIGLQVGDIIKSVYINDIEYKVNQHFEIGDILLNVRVGDSIKFGYTQGTTSSHIVTRTNLVAIS